jgi:hypothetical protein
MVVAMKTLAIEFTLTWATLVRDGAPGRQSVGDGADRDEVSSIRCRLLVNHVTDTEVFWRDRNQLDEEIWRGGHSYSLVLNGLYIEQATIIAYGLRRLTEFIHSDVRVAGAQEHPNSAIVFDLGTV